MAARSLGPAVPVLCRDAETKNLSAPLRPFAAPAVSWACRRRVTAPNALFGDEGSLAWVMRAIWRSLGGLRSR